MVYLDSIGIIQCLQNRLMHCEVQSYTDITDLCDDIFAVYSFRQEALPSYFHCWSHFALVRYGELNEIVITLAHFCILFNE